MKENDFLRQVEAKISNMGFTFSRIKTDSIQKKPDFQIEKGGQKFTVELKFKELDPEIYQEFIDSINERGSHEASIQIEYMNSVSKTIRKAEKQLISHDPNKESFFLVWYHANPPMAQAYFDIFFSTIYGSETLDSIDYSHTFTCYYFHESSFFTQKNIDGAILTDGQNLQLCLNTYSKRYEEFSKSSLVSSFAGAICDPLKLAFSDGALIADCFIPRNEEATVLDFLMKKYNFKHLQTMPMKHHQLFIKNSA